MTAMEAILTSRDREKTERKLADERRKAEDLLREQEKEADIARLDELAEDFFAAASSNHPLYPPELEDLQLMEVDQPPDRTQSPMPCGNGREVILQGFNWESWREDGSWYDKLASMAPSLSEAGFTAVWLPPITDSVSPQGYLPRDLYNLNSEYGSEHQLRHCLERLEEHGLIAVADIVINHRCADMQSDDGKWNVYGGRLSWDKRAIANNNPEFGGEGAPSTGEDYTPAPNIDHTQDFVRRDLKDWLLWLREDVGFKGWRFDFVKGYHGKFTGEYVDATRPLLSFGEYWDACEYTDSVLNYNQDPHRQRTINWIDQTGGNTAAFDFTTKGILQEAVGKKEYYRLVDKAGTPSGLLGLWPSRAVTFLENHDTGSTLQHWPFPPKHLAAGYCYLLTHPGTPTVFFDHWVDDHLGEDIRKLIALRQRAGISAQSAVKICKADTDVYAALVGVDTRGIGEAITGCGKEVDTRRPCICLKIGPGDWSPNREDIGGIRWKCTVSGRHYACWERADIVEIREMKGAR